nr:hypothetical protein [Candidatus Sigynarchaeota archaeon]
MGKTFPLSLSAKKLYIQLVATDNWRSEIQVEIKGRGRERGDHLESTMQFHFTGTGFRSDLLYEGTIDLSRWEDITAAITVKIALHDDPAFSKEHEVYCRVEPHGGGLLLIMNENDQLAWFGPTKGNLRHG